MTIVQLFRHCHSRPGTTASKIEALERDLGIHMPDDYKAFLMENDGAEGFLTPETYLAFWSTDEIRDLNKAYSVCEFLPDTVILGTNGSDTGYGLTSKDGTMYYFSVPLVGMDPSEVFIIGTKLEDVLIRLRGDGVQT